ncbi:MAG: PhnD/SsuA/transferrin family substrate-binding protein, partial [Pseudomonadota bacterium]|nr:PhnD/SsuA/transferrin family substrate-binding protein [Pseudomonadota bacterium]
AALADCKIDTVAQLVRDDDPWRAWRDPALLLGQTCGWPYVSALRDSVLPIARFDFGLGTAKPGDYFSVFIAPRGTARACSSPRELAPLLTDPATVIAVNATDSQSGFRVLGECLEQPLELPRRRQLLTGSHRESIRAVAQGRAMLAAIDSVTWQIARAHEPAAREVAVVTRSVDVPGLPLIVARGLAGHRDMILAALATGLARLPEEIHEILGLKGFVPAEDADYDVLLGRPFGDLRVANG